MKRVIVSVCTTLFFGFSVYGAGGHKPYGVWPLNNISTKNLDVAKKQPGLSATNISTLAIAWNFTTTALHHAVQSTPTIADGTIYFAASGGILYSLSESGVQNWAVPLLTSDGLPDYFDESPVITKDFVFVAGQQMHAINRMTGAEVWHTVWDQELVDHGVPSNQPLASQLTLAGDQVVVGYGYLAENNGGTSPSYFPWTQGEVVSFNQHTGAVVWRLNFTRVNGTQYGPGAGTFGGGAVDEKRHLIFLGSGNEYVAPASPFSDSFFAIDSNTGKIVWQFQYHANDVWGAGGTNTTAGIAANPGGVDLDVDAHPQLFSMGGKDYVGARAKDGTYRIFNRTQDDPSNVHPVAQFQFGPSTAGGGGGIPIEVVIHKGILYAASLVYVPTTAQPSDVDQYLSVDYLIMIGGFPAVAANPNADTIIRAFDLKRLITFGKKARKAGITQPIMVGEITPSNTSVGQLDPSIILWQNFLPNRTSSNSSGMTFFNDMIILPSSQGFFSIIDAKNGTVLEEFGKVDPKATIAGGISVDNGYLFVPLGQEFNLRDAGFGGVVAYHLP